MKKLVIVLIVIFSILTTSLTGYGLYLEIRQNKFNKEARAICAELKFPTIDIKTEKGKLPKDKENYVNCSFKISNCENEKYNIEVKMAENYGDEDSVGIRLRGNSTMNQPKKPYRIKFENKYPLMGQTKAKNWVLLADYFDYSNMKNYTAFNLAKKLNNMDFAPSANHVAVFINGDFQGIYLLTEQMDEKEGRTNVEPEEKFTADDKDFPFLIEMDRNALKEGVTGVDNFQVPGMYPIEIKYPKADEREIADTDIVFDYIVEYMTAVKTTLETGETTFRGKSVRFNDLVDVESLIDYYLCNEIMLNFDNAWGSIYMHKSIDGKLMFGPVWDFDVSMMATYDPKPTKSYLQDSQHINLGKHSYIFNTFLKNENNFDLVVDRWNEIKDSVETLTDDLSQYKSKIYKISMLDAKMWYGKKGQKHFNSQYNNVIAFLEMRYDFLDSTFNATYNEFLAKIS